MTNRRFASCAHRPLSCLAFAGLIGLTGCVVPPPSGPSFAAMPGNGKTFAQFTSDDARCRQAASYANGGVTAGQAAAQSGVASAAVGTGLGAAVGALAGAAGGAAGLGAAAGAGAGLLLGSAAGANASQATAANFQRNYDVTYAQCMAAAGESVPNLNAGYPAQAPAYGYAYPPPPVVAYGPPVVYAPPVVVGYGWGPRWRRGWW